MLIYLKIDEASLSLADASRRLEDLLADPEWLQLTAMIANDQPPPVRARALMSLRTGGKHHLLACRSAASEFRLLADYYLQATNQTDNEATHKPASAQPLLPHKTP